MNIDLAIIPIAQVITEIRSRNQTPFVPFTDASILPNEQTWQQLLAIEELTVVGYPSGVWDSVNNLPVIKRGITATHPRMDYEGRREFLIDAAIFQGSSGSPVFIFN